MKVSGNVFNNLSIRVYNDIISGALVVAGDIEFTMFVSVDQTMEKGANIIVDLQRQVIDKLTLVLAEQGYTLPKFHFWQFDNSGENKNKEMFCFASLLTELDLVTEVRRVLS